MSRASQLTLMDIAAEKPSWALDPRGEHGEVFTRRWVVEFILDIVGYRADEDLGASVIVEPSCGHGAFMVPIVERLAQSCARSGRSLRDLDHAIQGFDLLEHNAEHTRKAVLDKLLELGEPLDVAERLSGQWVLTDDFLLADHRGFEADFVVGNPPYLRLEDVPREVSNAYRRRLPTMRGRADVFVGFFERGLSLLASDGRLAFICADRWMRNVPDPTTVSDKTQEALRSAFRARDRAAASAAAWPLYGVDPETRLPTSRTEPRRRPRAGRYVLATRSTTRLEPPAAA